MDIIKHFFSKGHSLSPSQQLVFGLICFGSFFLNFILPQYPFIEDIYGTWPLMGIILSFLVASILLYRIIVSGQHVIWITNNKILLCFLLIAYTIHQYEENGIDLLFRKSPFVQFANELLTSYIPFISCHNVENCAFSPYNIMIYNTIGIWIPLFLTPIIYPTNPMYIFVICSLALINVFGHVCAVVLTQSYSPGVVTGLLLVAPLAYTIMFRALHSSFRDDMMLGGLYMCIALVAHGVYGGLVVLVDLSPEIPSYVFPVTVFVFFVAFPYAFSKVADLMRIEYLRNYEARIRNSVV